jgi:hypothetical protein
VEKIETSSSESATEANLRELASAQSKQNNQSPFSATTTTTSSATGDRRGSDKNTRQLLGELYVDKEYLEQLLNDKDFEHNPNEQVKQLILDGLRYLESRTEFWHQQKPIYARRKESGGSKSKPTQNLTPATAPAPAPPTNA